MDLCLLVQPFNLSDLDDDWAQDVWNGEFVEDSVSPPGHQFVGGEGTDISRVLYDLVKGLKGWRVEGDPSRTWRTAVGYVPHKKLSALLFHLLQRGLRDPSDTESRTRSMLAARTYISMLIVPGSNAYGVFHTQLYSRCLSCLGIGRSEDDDLLDPGDVDLVNRQAKSLLNDLCELVDGSFFRSGGPALEETVRRLVDFTADTRVADHRTRIDRDLIRKLKDQAHKCIDVLILDCEDGANKEVIDLVYKFLLPKLTNFGGASKKAKEVWHEAGASYCKELLQKYGTSSVPSFTRLIQHLCFNSEGMERGENRSRRVKLVVDLLASLPSQSYSDSLEWVVKLSKNVKPNLRLFALEVVCLVMGAERSVDEDISEEDESSENEEIPVRMRTVARRDLFNVALERCEDVSGAVRTKAMTILVFRTSPANRGIDSDTAKEAIESEVTLMELAKRRMGDERVAVRRTAMMLLHNLLAGNVLLVTPENLEELVGLCRDMSILVRCGAVTCLTRLAQLYPVDCVAEAWLSGPMHQLSDPEVKVQELVVENITALIVTSVDRHSEETNRGPWVLLSAVVRANMRRHLARACTMLAADSRIISNQLVETLLTHVQTENNLPCWTLLSCLARHIQTPDVHFVLNYFNESFVEQEVEDRRVLLLVLEVLGEWCSHLDRDRAVNLRSYLLGGLHSGRGLPTAATKHVVQLCVKLSRHSDISDGNPLSDWADNLLKERERRAGVEGNGGEVSENFTLEVADIALVSRQKPHMDTVDALIRIIDSFDRPSPGEGEKQTRRVASAVISLGKLSLRDRAIATKTAPLCARLLGLPDAPLSLRVNSMCVLTDLCTRFTSIVEPLLPGVCACLGSHSVAVRRTAVQLVTQLLVGDFLRLRGALFFHYLSLVRDPDERVRDVAGYYVLRCLVRKNAATLYHNFVESIFYYNGYTGHPAYGKFQVSDEEREVFTLKGEENRSSRHAIYDLMLSHMSDMQRLNTQVKLCREAESVECSEADLDGSEVLRDCVICLRRAAKPPNAGTSNLQDDDGTPKIAPTNISKKLRSNMVENVVPAMLRMYRLWKASGASLAPLLATYGCDLVKDYKQEIDEVFDADGETLAELKQLQEDGTPAD